jgi:hypothetical protein
MVTHYIGSGTRYGLICSFPALAWAEVATFFVCRCSTAVNEKLDKESKDIIFEAVLKAYLYYKEESRRTGVRRMK